MNTNHSNGSLKDSAMAFLQLASSGNVDKAYAHYVARNFKHHNPYYKGDRASLKKGMQDNTKAHPNKDFQMLLVFQEDDFVVIFSRVQPATSNLPVSVVHILRFDGNRIVELWDVIMPQPKKMVNENGLF
jgi:predicted SnoaL-like aldol condensation-catalyzing enzyme